jgi:hypothetical protein
MGSPMMHGHHQFGSGSGNPMMALFVPIPMAIFGVMVAFMFGATLGMKIGEKHSAMGGPSPRGPWMARMGGPKGMMGGMCGPKPGMMGHMVSRGPWMAAMAHHHHGMGAPCTCDHPEGDAPAAEGMTEEA